MTTSPARAFTPAFKREVCAFFVLHGHKETCRKHNIRSSTLYKWLARKPRAVTKVRLYASTPDAKKLEACRFSLENSIKETCFVYGISTSALFTWRQKFKLTPTTKQTK